MTSPALMIASSAALTSGGTRVGDLLVAGLKTSRNNSEISGHQRSPGRATRRPREDIRIVAVAALAAKADGSPPIVITTATCW